MTQRLKCIAAKIKRYSERVNQFHQNQLFETDQKIFYQSLDGEEQERVHHLNQMPLSTSGAPSGEGHTNTTQMQNG